jgi:hypothetical protein
MMVNLLCKWLVYFENVLELDATQKWRILALFPNEQNFEHNKSRQLVIFRSFVAKCGKMRII